MEVRRAKPDLLAAEEMPALNTITPELTDLYGSPGRFDQRQATLWNLVARETEMAERSMDALLALVSEATDRDS